MSMIDLGQYWRETGSWHAFWASMGFCVGWVAAFIIHMRWLKKFMKAIRDNSISVDGNIIRIPKSVFRSRGLFK